MKLPSHLNLWHELLALFPDDIADEIYKVAKKITPLLNAIEHVESLGQIEPNGFNGIDKSIHYERLLLTEWAIQDQYPDEFMRRAVSNEHLFLNSERIEHHNNKQSIVLFDCGPLQLGRPRLAQLAIFILLSRRAKNNSIDFYWGVLQDNNRMIYSGISQPLIETWLEQRTLIIAEQFHLDQWIKQLSSKDNKMIDELKLAELWIISPYNYNLSMITTYQLNICEPLLQPKHLDISLTSVNVNKSLSLMLGDESLNVRTIRNPFVDPTVPRFSMNEKHTGVSKIGVNGLKLACFNNDGDIVLYSIHKNKFKKSIPQEYLKINEGEVCVGIHLTKKMSVIMTIDDDFFYIHNYPQRKMIRQLNRTQSIKFPDDGRLLQVGLDNQASMLFMMDLNNKLFGLNLLSQNSGFYLINKEVASLNQTVNCVYASRLKKPQKEIEILWYLGNDPSRANFDIESEKESPQVFFHGSGPWHKSSIGALAFENDESIWTLISGSESHHKKFNLMVNIEEKVLGVLSICSGMHKDIGVNRLDDQLVLIVLKANNRSIHAIWDNGDQFLVELDDDFICGEINPHQPLLHYKNIHNEKLIINLMTGKIVFQVDNGEGQ